MDLIMVCDADFNIRESNKSANIVLGKGDSLTGEKCYSVLHHNKRQCLDCPLPDTINSGSVIPLIKFDTRYNEYFEERCFPIFSQDGSLEGFILITKNVTKSRELGEKSSQMKKLSALGQISSGVAHDFNNVLTVVLGRVQLLKKIFSDPYLQKSLDMIERSALDGAAKVRKIQEFSRPRSGSLTETVNLKNVLEEVIELTRPRWDTTSKIRGILIEPVLELKDELYIVGDPSDLRNAFTNIIFNAIDAMPEGGIMTVKTEQQGQFIYVTTKDTGIGMTEETIEKIFDPFFTTKGVTGNGLGMSEVYGITKRHNGKIDVFSEVGVGTTVRLRFTAIEKQAEVTEEKGVAQTQAFSILIIDDEEYILDTLQDFLSELGHKIITYTSPQKALEQVRKQRFDIVITDLGMPGISGLEVAEKVKAVNKSILVILISGWALNINEKDLENRIDFVINKPFSFEKIIYTLSEAEKKLQTVNST